MNLRIAFWRGDAACSLALAVAGAAFAFAAWRMPFDDDGAPGPGVAPFMLGVGLAAIGGFRVLRAVIEAKTERVTVLDRDLALVVGFLVGAIVAFEPLGFVPTAFAYLLASFTLVGREPLLRAFAAAFIATIILWWFFARALGVGLPAGILPLPG